MSDTNIARNNSMTTYIPDMPLIVWMLLITLALGFLNNMGATQLITIINTGFGRALGEFALILLPSFAMAAALSQHNISPPQGTAALISPIAGAGMVCPDTAYAALSPIAGRHKLATAFGSYAGFKLLYPAGPLIVATGLGVEDSSIALYSAALLIPVWAVGTLWSQFANQFPKERNADNHSGELVKTIRVFAPFGVLGVLLVIGAFADFTTLPLLDFATRPKGALLIAAAWAILGIESSKRRPCLDTATRRSGSLLLVIGAASAFGAILVAVVPIEKFVFIGEAGVFAVVGLFGLAVAFKLAQGSSMATFASVAPVAAPIVTGANISPVAAVLAICLGSFVAILPNDSFYWLVRRDAFDELESEGRAIYLLSSGAVLQALTGLIIVIAAVVGGLL